MRITTYEKGGNSLNPFIKLLFLFIIVILFSMPVNAISYDVDNPVAMVVDSNDYVYYIEDGTTKEIIYLDLYSGEGTTIAYNITANVTGIALNNDETEYYFVLSTGEIYKHATGGGLFDFIIQAETFTEIADVDAFTITKRPIVIDANNNKYISGGDADGKSVYKFSSIADAKSLLGTVTTNGINYLSLHPDGILVSSEIQNGQYETILLYSNGSQDNISPAATDSYYTYSLGVNSRNVYTTTSQKNIYNLNYSDSYNKTSMGVTTSEPNGIIMDSLGVIWICSIVDNKIEPYESLYDDYAFSPYQTIIGIKQLEYDSYSTYSLFDTYNNNSDIEIITNIIVDLSKSDITFDYFKNWYSYKIVLINPEGISNNNYDVWGNNFIESGYSILNNNKATLTLSRTLSSNNWQNGTWTVNLYEKDLNTGLYALLDTDDFLVLNESTETIIIDNTGIGDNPTSFQGNTEMLLNSPYLIGLFIMCVFLAIGAINGIGGTIVTGSIGLGIVCYMGIFPWILLVIEVLVIAALMAKGMINLTGD